MKSRKRRFKQDTSQDDPSDIEKEYDELRLCLTIAPDEDKEGSYSHLLLGEDLLVPDQTVSWKDYSKL
ncbi:hypothetical protein Tco_0345538 [Tanacetum coccineum]